MTLEAKIQQILDEPQFKWAAKWFRLGEVILQVPPREDRTRTAWATKTPTTDECPEDVIALGSTALNERGSFDWIGWDIDVGHGKTSYSNVQTAIHAGRLIQERVGGDCEIRLSKSGKGVHVRRLLESPATIEAVRSKAKAIANELGIRSDPTALSRQAFWFWSASRTADSFKLIESTQAEDDY